MQKLLIAESSEAFGAELAQKFCCRYQVELCHDGLTALELITRVHPDMLILDLMLPKLDGITLLANIREERPGIILAVTRMTSGYIQQAVKDLGVSYLMMKPCSPDAVFRRLEDIAGRYGMSAVSDAQELAGKILLGLGFSEKLDGYRQLRVGLPLYAQDPEMILTKEFYPAVAALCGSGDWRTAERSVRMSIRKAWETRDPAIWSRYFGDLQSTCPTTKVFLRRISEQLAKQALTRNAHIFSGGLSDSDFFLWSVQK